MPKTPSVVRYPNYWTSTEAQATRTLDEPPWAWSQTSAVGSKASCDNGESTGLGAGSSAFEDVVRQFPADARMLLADGLTDGGDAGSGMQPTLAAARLSCKALRRAVDDGLRSLRLNVMPGTEQGPAPSLSGFPNVSRLTLSMDAVWEPKHGSDYSKEQLPGKEPAQQLQFRSRQYAYPPSLLLAPLHGQPIQSLHRLRSLTLIGQLTCFRSLCEQLTAVFAAGAAAPDPGGAGPTEAGSGSHPSGAAASSSEDGTSGEESDSSEYECTRADGFDATASSNIMASKPADPSVAATAYSGGAGAGAGGGGAAAWSLEHLNFGNVRFPEISVTARDTVKGHRALSVLGLQELTLGVELLPGLEAHRGLHRLHTYNEHMPYVNRSGWLEAEALASLRRTPLLHVGLLGGAWTTDIAVEALDHMLDTLASVTLKDDGVATLTLGQDERGQATRKLELILLETHCAGYVVGMLSAWPRGLPPSARITLVRVTGTFRTDPEDMQKLSALLARAERVECAAVRVRARDVAQCLPLLHAVPREVELLVPRQYQYDEVRMHMAVAAAAAPRGGTDAVGLAGPGGGQSRDEAVDASAAAAATGAQLPTLDALLREAVGLMEARARARHPSQEQQQGMQQAGALGCVKGPSAQGRRGGGHQGGQHGTGGQRGGGRKSCGDVMERWWQEGKGRSGGGVVLVSGPSVFALAAHSTEAGAAALEGALEGLSRSQECTRDCRNKAYQVLPGGGGVLLRWDGGDVAEAAAEAVRCAAVQLGLEVPEGGVRAVALPHRNLEAACEGLYAGVAQVLQSRPLCPEDLVGQLQAVAELWGEVREQWGWPRCAAKPLASLPQPSAEASGL